MWPPKTWPDASSSRRWMSRPSRLCAASTDEPAWPTLRAHLLLLAAHGTDPVAQLAAAAGSRELDSADDRAAVLDWRLDDTGHRDAGQGPLPWLPGIPQGLRDHPVWGTYLAARCRPGPHAGRSGQSQPSPTPIRPHG